MKIGIISNREDENSLFTKKEDVAWKAIELSMYREFRQPYWKNKTLLIPIYTRFDRLVLRFAMLNKLAVELYVPSSDWGEKFLPSNQIELIKRAKSCYPVHVHDGQQARLEMMSLDCDAYCSLRTKDSFDFNESYLVGKVEYPLNIQQMLVEYQTRVAQ